MLPEGVESNHGSDINMGCSEPLINSSGVMACNSTSQSYLVDGCSPAIDTSTSDWASQLVTVRKTQTGDFTFDHVLLTFGFDTAVTLTGIELDLFLCPDMNIGARYITVYADKERNIVPTYSLLTNLPFKNDIPEDVPEPCDSLSNIIITFDDVLADSSYLTWHILFSSFTREINWVYVGEIRFISDSFQSMLTNIILYKLACFSY